MDKVIRRKTRNQVSNMLISRQRRKEEKKDRGKEGKR
jgi:hypothetical protein